MKIELPIYSQNIFMYMIFYHVTKIKSIKLVVVIVNHLKTIKLLEKAEFQSPIGLYNFKKTTSPNYCITV